MFDYNETKLFLVTQGVSINNIIIIFRNINKFHHVKRAKTPNLPKCNHGI
jgi:hypothetical protein